MSAEAITWRAKTDSRPGDGRSAVAMGGVTCSLSLRSYSGTHEESVLEPHHHFCSVREVQHGNRLMAHGSFDGERIITRKVGERDSFFLPMGRRWIGKCRGSATFRILECDLEHSALEQVFGDRIGIFDLEPQFGASLIAPGLMERLEALCLAAETFPRSYAEALAVMFTCELLRACATKPFALPGSVNVGKSRFKPVLDHIEDTLESDTSLSDLAAITGLSVSHFSHAFNAAYGVAPHRYILQRRIDKAKMLLVNSDFTIAAISSRVGFSSQSRFTQIFSRQTGFTPSAYRLEQQR
jgi:AraC family transcriptional regulator